MSLSLRIDLAPRGKERPRTARGRRGVYTPTATLEWERAAEMQLRRQLADAGLTEPMEGALEVAILAVLPRPQSLPRVRNAGRRWAPVKPDMDNVEKCVWDALVNARAMVDDGQIVSSAARKVYAAHGEAAHVEITIAPVAALEVA